MTVSCLGALLAGMLASLALPFLPFACALTLAAVVGGIWTIAQGHSSGHVLLWAAALLVTTQIGYGIGLLARAAVSFVARSARRAPSDKPDKVQIHNLHLGEKS